MNPSGVTTVVELSELKEMFQEIFRSSPFAISITRLKNGEFVDVNDAFVSISGFTRADALANSAVGLDIWVNIEDRKNLIASLEKGEQVKNREYQLRRKNGEIIICDFFANMISINSEQLVLSSIIDITERKKIEYKASISELRYRRLFESAQDGILLIDFEDGMILDVNQYLIDLLGYSKDNFLGKHLWEVGIFKDIAASKENFVTLQEKRYVRFEDLPLEKQDGQLVEVEFVANAYKEDGNTIIQCNIRNITDRKKIERMAQALKDKTYDETKQLNRYMIDRELKMVELKDINRVLTLKISELESIINTK